MTSLFTWFGLKSPVMPANRYTSDSPTVLANETESPISSGMTLPASSCPTSPFLCTHDSFRFKLVDLFRAVADFGQYLLRVFSEFGGQDAQRWHLPVVAHRVGEHPHLASPRVLEGHYRLVVDHLRVLLDLVVGVHRCVPDPDLLEHPEPMLRGFPTEMPRYVSVHLFSLAELVFLGPLAKRLVPERLGHLLRRRKRHADVAVGRLEDAVWGLVKPRGDARLAALVEVPVEVVDERFDLQIQRRAKEVAIDSFTLTRVPTLVEGGKDAKSPEHRRVLVHDGGADQGGRVAFAAVDRRQAAHGLAQEVLASPVPVRAVRAVAREGAVYEVWPFLGNFFVAEAQALHSARPVILDDDVRIADQTPHDLLATFGAQVHAQAALVASAEEEEDANPVQISLSPRPVSLPGPFRGFYLDDIGPEVGQDLHGGGALQEVREAKDLNPVQHSLTGPFCWTSTDHNKPSSLLFVCVVPDDVNFRGSRKARFSLLEECAYPFRAVLGLE